jgi:hypothetical protein
MKYFRFMVVSLLLLIAYNVPAYACHLPDFNSFTQIDTSKYQLKIFKFQFPLKDTIFHGEKCLVTHCPVTLINNSKDTLKYMAMSASWWDLYALDNKNFELAADPWDVYKNETEVLTVPPYQSRTRSIPIITYKGYYRGQKLRIGMSLQRPGFELPDLKMSVLELKPKTTNLIWSNEVTIN